MPQSVQPPMKRCTESPGLRLLVLSAGDNDDGDDVDDDDDDGGDDGDDDD